MMPRIQTRRLAVLGGLLILNTASPSHGLFEEEESFGPQDAFEGPSYTNGYGNTSNQTNTTTTTTVTTTTELPAIPHIHIAYFLAKVNRTNPNTGAHNEPPENIDCSLTSIGQGAYFINLPVTETCEEMPDIEVHMPKMYYKLTIDMSNGNERNITHLTAFCTESEAGLCSNCKVNRVPDTVIHPDYPHGLMGNSVLRYDLCEPTEGKEDFSYFVRQGKGSDNLKKDICLLKNQVPDSKFGITQLRYPDDSLCSDDMPGAVVASSLRALEQREDCDRNEFDDTHYKLVSVGSKLDGFIGCTSGCEPETCERFDGVWGQCSGHEEGGKGGNNHYKFFPTRTNGMDEAGAAKNRSFPLCAGQKATPTPRHMTTPMPTTVPSAVKEKYKLPMIILGSLFGACICSYLIFYVLRKRKLQRMSSYAALQDDPTF